MKLSDLDPDTVFGLHGYDNQAENMRPFFIAHGPAFKQGIEIEPFNNIDLFPLICQMMNISTPANNGSLDIIQGILRHNYLSGSVAISVSPTMQILVVITMYLL